MFSTLISATFVGLSVAGYTLQDDYMNGDFFDNWTFFTGADPTNGFVDYVDQATAQSNGYINSSSNSVYIGTDSVNTAGSGGRESVRITSNKSYDSGLIILDLEHMPGGICGTWPAFWTVGPNWPNAGEIDIIEGVNSQSTNAMTLHTADGCTINKSGDFSGTVATDNCYVDASGQSANAGCSIDNANTQTYGSGFNAVNGGVYATNYESTGISVWFFPRSSIPSDISSGSPDPSGWGEPLATFSGSCNIDNMIKSQQIVFDLTFCGDWAGAVWSTDSTCSAKASTCQDFVQNNPSAFQDAYWMINGLKVYSNDGSSYTAASSAAATWSSSAPAAPWPSSSVLGSSLSAAGYSASSTQTTFAVSTKAWSASQSTGAPSVAPYSTGNDTVAPYLNGSATNVGTAPVASASAAPIASSVVASSYSAPVQPSPPLTTAAASYAPASTADSTTSAQSAWQSNWWASHGWSHGNWNIKRAAKRHLGRHRRHAAGLQ